MILMLHYYAVLNLLKGQGFGSLRDVKSEVNATRIYKAMQLSYQRVTPKISPQTKAAFMQPRNAQIVPFVFRHSLTKAS